MISTFSAVVFGLSLILVILYTIWSLSSRKQRQLLHRLYLYLVLLYASWAVVMLGMWVTPFENTARLQLLDSLTYIGGGMIPVFYLLICYFLAF